MTKWIDDYEASEVLGMNRNTFRRLLRSSDNPPPFVRPSSRTIVFDESALLKWRAGWLKSTDMEVQK
jgi:predicted DNA-binding transcriptional regulator AlpA